MQSLNSGTAELQDKEFSVCRIRTAELKVIEYSVCGSGTSSHIIFCVWRISGSLCNGPNDMRAQGPQAPGHSHLEGAVIFCSILAVSPTGIFCVFSLLL